MEPGNSLQICSTKVFFSDRNLFITLFFWNFIEMEFVDNYRNTDSFSSLKLPDGLDLSFDDNPQFHDLPIIACQNC